jgi:hypothetical protein
MNGPQLYRGHRLSWRITVLAGKQTFFKLANKMSIFMELDTTCQCSKHRATNSYYRRVGLIPYPFNSLLPSASRSLKWYFFLQV